MNIHRIEQVELVLAALQQRWGAKALRRGTALAQSRTYIATGIKALDDHLSGGIPAGHLTEVVGEPTSGMTTLALRLVTEAQRIGHLAAYLDMGGHFDADYALLQGIDRQRLLIVQPEDTTQALTICRDIIISGYVGLIVLNTIDSDVGALDALVNSLPSLVRLASNTACTLITLTATGYQARLLTDVAALRLQVRRDGWIQKRSRVIGYPVTATIVKHKYQAAGQTISFDVLLEGARV